MVQLKSAIESSYVYLFKKWILTGCLLMWWLGVYAQGVEFVHVTKLESNQGMSSPNIRKIVKDKYGFVWIATQDGLNRFDGFSLTHFNSNQQDHKKVVSENDFQDIIVDNKRDLLWGLTSYGGVSSINVRTISIEDNIPLDKKAGTNVTGWYSCFSILGDTLVVGTQQGFLLFLDIRKKEVVKLVALSYYFANKTRVEKLFVDKDENIWVFSAGNGVLIADKNFSGVVKKISSQELMAGNTQPGLNFYDILPFDPNHLMVATSQGLKTFSIMSKSVLEDSLIIKRNSHTLPSEAVFALQAGDSCLYVAYSQSFYKYNLIRKAWIELCASGGYSDKKWLHPVNCIMADEDRLWLGNQLGLGWAKKIHSPFAGYKNSMDGENVELNHCYFIYPLNDSIIYACSANGLYKINHFNGLFSLVDGRQPYYNIFRSGQHELIASGDKGMVFAGNQTGVV
ncbi:MAG: hypothetical protein J7497_15885, partial [Chitinophagaceae bacterium]|nr:hypothetical protein [Chitinophagaceae bacterium]